MFQLFSSLFGAPPIAPTEVNKLEESAPDLILWSAPVVFFFVLLEWYLSYKQHDKLYEGKETLGSLGVGIGNALINTA